MSDDVIQKIFDRAGLEQMINKQTFFLQEK